MESYPTKYTDAVGSQETAITNDGNLLRVRIRGIEFSGSEFDDFEPPSGATAEELKTFTLNQGCLCSCSFEFGIPMPMETSGQQEYGKLSIGLRLGDSLPSGGLDSEQLRIRLHYQGRQFGGQDDSGWFEDALLDIQRRLPTGVFMKACINCLYSDYSPGGHGLFGHLMCFKNIKDDYLKVRTKDEFWPLHGDCDRLVQETYRCPDFERRVPGTGYRG